MSERYYNRLLVADKRYIGEKVKGDGTFTHKEEVYLAYSGAPIMADQNCPTRFFFISEDNLKKYVLAKRFGESKSIKYGEGCDANPVQTGEEISLAA